MPSTKKTVSFILDDDIDNALEGLSEKESVSKSHVIRQILKKHLKGL